MKSCPTCNRTYPDDTLAFCLMDGSVLSAPFDPSETRAASRRSNEPPPTEVIRAPANSAEPRAPLQSTIRAPVPDVPPLHGQKETTVVPEAVRAGAVLSAPYDQQANPAAGASNTLRTEVMPPDHQASQVTEVESSLANAQSTNADQSEPDANAWLWPLLVLVLVGTVLLFIFVIGR